MRKNPIFTPFCKFEPWQLRKKHGDPPLSLQVFDVPWSHLHKMLLWVVVKLLFMPQETRKSGKNDVFWVCGR